MNTKPVALVTGAAKGIGRAVALSLAESGCAVALLDNDTTALEQLSNELQKQGYSACSYPVDISNQQQVIAAVEQIEQELGPIQKLASVAGILRPGSLLEMTPEDWQQTLEVNTSGVFYICQAVARNMVQRQSGSIVVAGSNAADTPRTGMGAYPASKAATHQFVRCLGLELAEHGIRCNLVSPGSTDTDMQRQLWHSPDDRERVIAGDQNSFRLGIPLNRIADPQDIADAVLFLLSDKARHITMHDLRVDGGATL